jgi:hypothetical protein
VYQVSAHRMQLAVLLISCNLAAFSLLRHAYPLCRHVVERLSAI